MRVGTTIPEEGTIFDWDIAELMERESCDTPSYSNDWDECLKKKRNDSHYDDVKESIQRWGFVRPLTAYISYGELRFGDGHHRLAAAIDLGMTTVPVQVYEYTMIAEDSGEWDLVHGGIESARTVEVY